MISGKAIQGKADFLFLGGADSNDLMVHLTGELKLSPAAKYIFSRNLVNLDGIKCPWTILIVPEAHCIYSDLLPCDKEIHPQRPAIEVSRRWEEHVIYPVEYLNKLRREGVAVYTGDDSHWTEVAAFRTYELIREKLGRNFPPCGGYTPKEDREAKDLRYGNDVHRRERDIREFGNVPFKSVFTNGLLNHGSASFLFNPKGQGRLVAFGTSFSTRLCPAYATDFREVFFFYGTAADSWIIEKCDPDAVIVEMPERFVHYPSLGRRGGVPLGALLASNESGELGRRRINTSLPISDCMRDFSLFFGGLSDLIGPAKLGLKVFGSTIAPDSVLFAVEACIKLAEKFEERRWLRMLIGGQYRRDGLLYKLFQEIDRNSFDEQSVALFPDSEMGILGRIRYYLRAGDRYRASSLLECLYLNFGLSREAEYYAAFLRRELQGR